VFYGSAATEAPACADEDVYVVGGANAAGQAAVFLSRDARRVTLLVRADGLERSMSHDLIRQIRDTPSTLVRPRIQVAAAAGQGHLERLTLCDTGAGTVQEVPASFLFVFIGAAPCTEWLDGVIERDSGGFILRWTATPTTWRAACRGSSRPATCAPTR
jgi:thioredoxin reductase (NADPH)